MTNELYQSNTMQTNEVKLQDRRGSKMSVTFGDNDSYAEYCYFNLKFRANETIATAIFDRDILNIAGPRSLLLNDAKVWHANNDGPNSGLNADKLDGKHATEFKDRYGYHHFIHMFTPPTKAKKHFVKVATFTTRKVGDAKNFTADGKPPYEGTFNYSGNGVMGVSTTDVVTHGGDLSNTLTSLAINDAKEQFMIDTPLTLDDHEPDLFHTTNLLTQGIYNGALRGTVTMLKEKKPTTFDFHIGLFEDPLSKDKDGWTAVDKLFYVSLHDETLNFLEEVESDWDTGVYNDSHLNPGVPDGQNTNENTDDINKSNGSYKDGYTGHDPFSRVSVSSVNKASMANIDQIKSQYNNDIVSAVNDQIEKLKQVSDGTEAMGTLDDDEVKNGYTSDKKYNGAKVSEAAVNHTHGRPGANKNTYGKPVDTIQDTYPYDPNRMREPFPAKNAEDQGDSYQKYIDIMRLYHSGSRVDTIDNLEVVTHVFDLYLCVDEKTEVRIQPYLSTACLLYNFEPCIQEDSLPKRKFIRPKSIYDSRYASVRHRHYDYEKRIWQLIIETNEIWKNFNNYVKIHQGSSNANKALMTDSNGDVYCAEDNFERHAETLDRREANKVLVTAQYKKTINGVLTDLACIVTSTITVDQLAQLDHIKSNIQDQLDELARRISDLEDRMDELEEKVDGLEQKISDMEGQLGDFVKKAGDTMSGPLWMDAKATTGESEKSGGCGAFGFSSGGYIYGGTPDCDIGAANGPGNGDWCFKWKGGFAINGEYLMFGDVDPVTGKYVGDSHDGFKLDLRALFDLLKDE